MTLRLPKNLFLIAIIGLCLLIIGFIILINLPRQDQEEQSLIPTPTSVPGQLRQGTSSLRPKRISPAESTSGTTIKNPSQKITYTLSEPTNPTEVRVRVSPYLPVKVQQGTSSSDLVVFPDPPEFWRPNILYTVTLYDARGESITSYRIKVPPLEVDDIRD